MDLSAFSTKLRKGESVTLSFVGDSITWGLNHCSPEETYVAAFARLFAENYDRYKVLRYDGIVERESLPLVGYDGPFVVGGEGNAPVCTVIRNGVGGNTVRRAIRRKEDFLGKMPNGKYPDVTFLMFGINDALSCDANKYVTPERFARDYEELLDLFERESDTAIIILSPTYNGTKYPLEPYADVTERIARERDLPFLDTHGLWIAHFDDKAPHFGQGDWLSDSLTDACHFSPAGALATARFLFDGFREILAKAH